MLCFHCVVVGNGCDTSPCLVGLLLTFRCTFLAFSNNINQVIPFMLVMLQKITIYDG